jgi:hypothetical protein
MRISVRKHYAQHDQFVRAANLGWQEIFRRNDFPTLEKLDPLGAHRWLLARIDRAFQSKFRKIRPPADVPLLILPRWRSAALADWQRLHCYALVRRLFDSCDFLTRRSPHPRSGTRQIPLALQVSVNADGSISRVRDPYEDFLAELSRTGLRRVSSINSFARTENVAGGSGKIISASWEMQNKRASSINPARYPMPAASSARPNPTAARCAGSASPW